LEVAQRMSAVLDKKEIEPEVSGKYRVGDIRHCFADIRLARRLLGYQPKVTFEEGLAELSAWLEGQVADDHVGRMQAELNKRGLAI
jgi:dTDP-L-rhamnose 4-epimerase